MAEDVLGLFDEFAVAHARGERPDVRAYLARAGDGADELRELLDRYLVAAPPAAPTEEEVAAVRAWAGGEPPLLELRRRRGIRREQVVAALVERLALDPRKGEKVAGYVHRAETGLLDPGPVDRRVWEVWSAVLSARVADVVGLRPPPLEARPAYRAVPGMPAAAGAYDPFFDQAKPPRDEVDRLFLGG